ncbi:hypothetical protein NDU88_000947 [Pleurodeles waltl]|uniref:Uncharacterized protein n=1 Tax=Pleurodeles waltl TaxID=8319 RepID=A0AAV7LBQ5_PLEWA|nr:hypothetical protein NDU88_000947 [Pleurodeles waltl]
MHRQQAGGASMGILPAAVQPRSETENRRCPAGFPLPWGILHGGAAGNTTMGIPTPLPPACVCIADTENRDGCHCTRRTLSTPPAPFGAGILVEGRFPLGGRAAFWRSPARPAGNSELPRRSFDRAAVFWRFPLGGRLPLPVKLRITPLISSKNSLCIENRRKACRINTGLHCGGEIAAQPNGATQQRLPDWNFDAATGCDGKFDASPTGSMHCLLLLPAC